MSLFDDLGGLVKQGENKVGSFLQGMNPSRPAQPSNPPLPSPQVSAQSAPKQPAQKPPSFDLLGTLGNAKNSPGQLFINSDFAKNTGINQLWSNTLGQDSTNSNTIEGQAADPNSQITQLQNTIKNNPISGAANYVSNVLNAGVIDPIRLAADPQMWFAEDNQPSVKGGLPYYFSPAEAANQNILGNGPGHNYLRDVLAPIIKGVTGEDVPPSMYSYTDQTQSLTDEGNKLTQAQTQLNPNSSQEDIDAYNSKLAEYNAKVNQYKQQYAKTQDWWTNSNIAKTLSVLGQVATFPAGFAAGAATFLPSLIADPIGSGEGLISQVQQAVNFTGKLMDPEARDHMSAEELSSNISNIAMLAGMLYGAKGTLKGARGFKDTILGRKPDADMIAQIQNKLHESTPELRNPDQAPQVNMPPVTANDPRSLRSAQTEQNQEDAGALRERIMQTNDPGQKAVLQKQLNDITDQTSNVNRMAASKPGEGPMTSSGRSIEGSPSERVQQLLGHTPEQVFEMLGTHDAETIASYYRKGRGDEGYAEEVMRAIEDYNTEKSGDEYQRYAQNVTVRPGESAETAQNRGDQRVKQNFETTNDLGREATTEQRGQYTKPVYPNTGFDDRPADTLLKDLQDFSRPAIMQEAMRKNPQDYASPSSKTGEGPVPFEEMQPETIEIMAQSEGYRVTTPDQIEGNAFISPTGKAIEIPEGSQHLDFTGHFNPYPQGGLDGVESMLRSGWIKVSDMDSFKAYAVDMLDPQNIKSIEQAMVADILKGPSDIGTRSVPRLPYQVVETATNRTYQITPQELAANNFNLARTIAQQKRIMPRSQPGFGPSKFIEELKPQQLVQAVKETGWKLIPANKVEYGWLFPGGKGAELGLRENRGVHDDLSLGVARTLGRELLSPSEWHQIKKDWVELRRGYGRDINDHYFFAEKWTPQTLKIVDDYLNEKQTERPSFIALESRNSVKLAGRSTFDSLFTWDEFKNNDFKLEGLMGKRSPVFGKPGDAPGERTRDQVARRISEEKAAQLQQEEMGPWLHDKFTDLQKARNQINFFEDRINRYQVEGKNTHADETQVKLVLEKVQRTIADLPEKVSPQLEAIRNELQGVLNEKGYTAINEASTSSEAGASGEGYNQAPPGAPEGSALTSIIPGPEGQAPISIWSPNAESTGTVSARERGRLELNKELNKSIYELTTDYNEAADLEKLEQHPVNFKRRSDELINVFKAKAENLDPIGVAQIRHFVIDPVLETDAQFDPNTGIISVNPYKAALTDWARNAAGNMQRGFQEVRDLIPDEGRALAYKWIQDTKNLTQAQLDFKLIAEEILHKYDVDHFSEKQYFEALSRLPWTWWGHADRSGLGDIIEGGLVRADDQGEFTLHTKDGQPVNSWLDAFYAGRNELLDDRSRAATMHTFMEYRVTQLMNYHGIPGSLFTYRVPEVMYRELENPSLIYEGAKLAGDDFERYVENETARSLSFKKVYEERTQANAQGTPTGVPTMAPTTGNSTATSPAAGIPGRNAGDQTSVSARTSKGPESIPDSIGARFAYQPLLELGKTGYPGQWEDFLSSMTQPQDSLAYRTAKPYWDKLDPRWQETFMEAMQQPGVETAIVNRTANPRPETPLASQVNSPTFQARQQKIKEYQTDVAASGPTLDRLQKSVSTAAGLKKYNQTKALTAAKQKYIDLGPGVPEQEAIQLSGQEFTRVMNELTKDKQSANNPGELQVNKSTPELINQLQPVLRNYLQDKVVSRIEGKVSEGYYPSLERFVDAYASGEEPAKKLYAKLPKTSKDAIRGLVNQMPQSFKIPGRERLDQTSIPESQQTSQEHINPTLEGQFHALVNTGEKFLIRHGSTDYNEKGLVSSHDDPPLSSLGRLQARNLARSFKDKKNLKIVTNDLERAYETAATIAKSARGSKVTVDPDLRPWNVGPKLTGTSKSSANPQIQKWIHNEPDFTPEGGESFNQFKDRYINALRRHLGEADVIVGSGENLRLAEGWLGADRPNDNSFEDTPLRTVREVGPGGMLTVGYKGDSGYTVTNKASQMPAEAGNISIPKVKSQEPLRPTTLTVNMRRTEKPTQPQGTVNQQTALNIKLGESANEKAAKVKGEIVSPVKEDQNNRIDSIVQDPSIPANSPLKIAATKAKIARDSAQSAREMGVPREAIEAQQKEYTINLEKITKLETEKAQLEARVAAQTTPKPANQLIWDVSRDKAELHQKRVLAGKDVNESATQAAKEMGIFNKKDPYNDAIAKIKDASMKLLPSDHEAYSLSPAFKDVFIDPQALELIKQEAQSEPPKQSQLLPLSVEEMTGSDVKPLEVRVNRSNTKPTKSIKSKAPVMPTEVENLAAHTPPIITLNIPPDVHESVRDYHSNIAAHDKKPTKDLRAETVEAGKAINQESPDLFQEAEEFDTQEPLDIARTGKLTIPDAAAEQTKAGGVGGKPPKNNDPFSGSGWDDKRDFAMSFGGDLQRLARRLDYALKMSAKFHDPTANAAHPVQMALSFLAKRVEAIYVGDETKTLLQKLIPGEVDKNGNWKNVEQLTRHQAIAKAVGGYDEPARQAAMKSLSYQDQAIANMLDSYHQIIGKLGTRPETHLWDEAQEHYFTRQVLFNENGEKVNVHGNIRMSTKMDIAFKRRKRDEVIGLDGEGDPVIKTMNYYKDTEDLKKAGFKVEENIANLWGHHWNAYSNMNITHQFVQLLSTLHSFRETNSGLSGIRKGATPFVGRVLIPRAENVGGKMRAAMINDDLRSQLTTVTQGPWTRALSNYYVYKPVSDILERMGSVTGSEDLAQRTANALSQANGVWKIAKFAFNPIHLFNLYSNVYALGTKGLLDPAMYNPYSLQARIYGRVDKFLSDQGTFKNFDGSAIQGKDMIAKIMSWGGVLRKDIIDVASLGGLTGALSRNVPGFKQWHNFMWHQVAWKGQVGLTLHLMDVMRAKYEKYLTESEGGRQMNEAEFENMGRLATQQAKYAMGFLSKGDMNRNYQIYANSFFLANSWSTAQIRQLGMTAGKRVPGAQYLANIGGGEKYNDTITSQMEALGGMTQQGLSKINSYEGNMARRMMLGGSAKLLATSIILTYLGSYFGNQGQTQGPWENFQRDPTHTFDAYLGTDPQTKKDKWLHNPTFGMQQEMLLYMLQAMKEHQSGGNPYDMFMSAVGRVANKTNPILSTSLDMAVNRNLSLYLQGFGDRSAIDKDPQVIAIRRALDATGKNPFPDSLTNNLIYAVRSLAPSPGYPDTLNTTHGTNPDMTNATLGNTLNALGPGKVGGLGDIINAIQTGDGSSLLQKELGGLAMWLTGTRIATSSTPEAIATNNQIDASIQTRDAKNQSIADMDQAAYQGDWKTVAQISQELGLSNSELIQALEHPPTGTGAGSGIIYNGLPGKSSVTPGTQDTLMGQVLTPAQTTELETLKQATTISMIKQITSLPEFQSGDQTTRSGMLSAYTSLVDGMVNDMYSQKLGLLGGTDITQADIQATLNTAIEFHGLSEQVLSQMNTYVRADPLERQRMDLTYGQYAINLAKNAYNGNLRNVPLENIRQILGYTITTEESTRAYLENSMFYQLSGPDDQNRMMTEYSSLAREVAKREALQQGQGSYAFRIPPEKMIPTIQFIINVEETAKSQLHGTDYYNSETPDVQKTLDLKYETLARGLAFSTSNADPRTLIQNSLNADSQYYGLQNQFGGSSYIKLMSQQLSDLERSIRTGAAYTPKQIASMERSIRTQFLQHNPAYAAWLKARTNWQKYTADGQIYQALNNSEYAAVSDMQSAGVVSSNSLLLSGTSIDQTPLDPSTSMGLPSVDYAGFAASNP